MVDKSQNSSTREVSDIHTHTSGVLSPWHRPVIKILLDRSIEFIPGVSGMRREQNTDPVMTVPFTSDTNQSRLSRPCMLITYCN